ncbi:MAG: DUF2723 domain-containing protein [Pedobacter agri]
MNYSKINTITGWLCFSIAAITYILTLDQSVSFWDCGEFIASAFRMQVVHQPGAPIVSMIQRLFSTLALGDKNMIAYFMNVSSALASAGTILFLFWTITTLAKKTIIKKAEEITSAQIISIIGAGLVGALAYAFSDSFWFSAVEAEVYAMSSLCTAIVFWGILKWESIADEPEADRWLLFVAYIMGLSIGVHLLNLLAIPALIFVYYFKKNPNPNWKSVLKVFMISILALAFVQFGIIQYMISFAASFDYFFVNTIGLGFGSGILFFATLVIGALVYGVLYSNDTYPVWYAQEVENVRPDVRVVNLSLFTADWYIDGLKRKQNQSEPLPLTIKPEQYVAGTRDVMYYQDFKIAQHVELKDILEVLLSENDQDKATMSDGSKYNILPTKNLKLTVNPKQVLDTGTVPKEDAGKIANSMEWTYAGNYVSKGTLALFDILTHNNWERPIYFTNTMPKDQYVGLDKYLYTEGMNKRLLPLKPDSASSENEELINPKPMFNNLMKVYAYGNIKNANHLDRQSADDVTYVSNMFGGLLTKLIDEGKINEEKN